MNIDPYWQEAHKRQRWGVYVDLNLVRFMLRQFGTEPDRSKVKCLDLGCGAGASALFLAQEGFDVLAVDGSPDAIKALNAERARRKITGHNLATMVADLTSFDIPLGFDCVIDICTLQHLSDTDARQVIARAKQWLKPKGWFFSIMASPGWSIRDVPCLPRTIDRKWLETVFTGYKTMIGHEDVMRPDGEGHVCHWIVQAQKDR